MYINSSVSANNLLRTGGTIPPVHKQKNFKQSLIQSAAKVFCLSEFEKEHLANKAGLSFHADKNFNLYFKNLFEKSDKSCREIYEEAQVSERMFYLIKSHRVPAKTTLIAIAIALNMNIDEIETLLQKAGYVLSESIAFDMIVKRLIKNYKRITNRLIDMNAVLYDLGFPLLMGREKNTKVSKNGD